MSQTTGELNKYTRSRRFQNTGKQLMNCQRFVAYSKEEGAALLHVIEHTHNVSPYAPGRVTITR